MRQFSLLTVALLILASPAPRLWAAPAPDETPATKPAGTAPRLVAVAGVDGGSNSLNIEVQLQVMVPVTVEQVVEINGVKQKRTVTTYQTNTQVQQQKISLEGATISTAGGEKLTDKEALKRLAKGGPVIVSNDGKAIDASWLRLFRSEVVVVVPAASGTAPGFPGGAIGGPVPVPILPAPPIAVPALPPVKVPEKKAE